MSHAVFAADASARPSAPAGGAMATRLATPAGGSAAGDVEGGLAFANLARIIDRLEETVDQETAALRSRISFDLKDFNNRKSHALLELTRAMRPFEREGLGEPMRARLAQLRAKLETNRAVLEMHVEAVREIATIMADAIREAESDGTYSAAIAKRGPVS